MVRASLLLVAATAVSPAAAGRNHGHVEMASPKPSIVTSPLPHTYLSPADLPASYDIRDLNGKSLATDNRNQHIPQVKSTVLMGLHRFSPRSSSWSSSPSSRPAVWRAHRDDGWRC